MNYLLVLSLFPGIGLLDMAFDPGTSAWTLNAHGEWTRNTGETDMQAALVERQRRHRASP